MKDFELSLWRTVPKSLELTNETFSYLGEEKVYILASSNSLENPYRAYDIHFVRKINSEKTVTFKVLKECFDPQTGKVENNYFVDLLVNKALIKLKYKNKWYDFLIQEREETRDQKGVGYKFTCEDLSICELSKNGYSLEFDEETGVGDIDALGAEIIKGTTYNYQNSAAGSFTEYKEGYEYDTTSKTYKEQRTPVAIAKMDKSAYYGKYLQKAKDIWCTLESEGGELIDQTPYNFQKITYDDEVVTDKIIGGTIAWNQLVAINTSAMGEVNGITFVKNSDNSIHIYGTASAQVQRAISNTFYVYADHKYYITGLGDGSVQKWDTRIGSTATFVRNFTYNKNAILSCIGTIETTFVITIRNGATIDKTFYPQCIDLTQVFGSTIADYMYSLETATAGAGIAWLKAHGFFTKPYYAYNAGSLESVNTSAHITRGFNAWDEEWEVGGIANATGKNFSTNDRIRAKNYNMALPSTTYYLHIGKTFGYCNVFFYAADNSFISQQQIGTSSQLFETPSTCAYFRFCIQPTYGTTYKNDICINISQPDTAISPHNGDYVHYSENTYPLDSSLTLNGLYKLNANNELYCDGDEYPSSGSSTKKYVKVDMGTLNWTYNSTYSVFYVSLNSIGGKPMNKYGSYIGICDKYPTNTQKTLSSMPDKSIDVGSGYGASTICSCLVKDSSYTDAAVFKTAMSGHYLICELATPTTEVAAPFANPQRSILGGTSQYVDYAYSQGDRDVEIPVGHQTSTIVPTSIYLAPENIKVEPVVVKNMVSNSKDFTTLSGWESEVGNQLELYSEYRNSNELQGLNYFLKFKGGDQWYYNNNMINGKTDFRTGKMYVFHYTASSQIFSQFSIYDGYHFIDGTGSTSEPIFTSGNTTLTQDTYFMFTPAQYIKYPQLALKTTNSSDQLLESIEIFEVACESATNMDSFQNLVLANGIIALNSNQVDKLILPGDTSSISAAGLYTTYKYQWFENINDEEGEPHTISFAQYHTCDPSDITPFNYGATGASGDFSTLYGYCEGTYYTKVSGAIVEVDDVDRSTEYKKRRTLIASKSNRYQLLQDISELFNGWVKIDIQHKANGEIDYELNASNGISYKKYVSFVEVVGKENDVGFKYGVNLKSISRKINSKEITTKTIVESNENSAVDRGVISIAQAPSNPTKENFIYNFRYFVNAGIIDGDILNTRLYGTNGLEAAIGRINNEIFSLNEKLMSAENKLEELKTQRDTYETMRGTAKKSIDSLVEDIIKSDLDILAGKGGLSPMTIRDKRIVMAGQAQRISELNKAIATEDENNILPAATISTAQYGLNVTLDSSQTDKNYSYWSLNDGVIIALNGTNLAESKRNFDTFVVPASTQSVTLNITLFNPVAVTASSMDDVKIEELYSYNDIYSHTEGTEEVYYKILQSTTSATFESIDPLTYIPTLIDNFVLSQSLYCPGQYQPRQEGDYLSTIQELETEVNSYQSQIDTLQSEKEALIASFENEYSRYLSEGTWTDNNYVDNDEFYFDALQVAHTSSMPTADYTINVVDITNILDYVDEFPHQEDYEFDLGDKTFVTDEELYGKDKNGVLIRQEVIISELESVLDNPAKSTLKVQNYRTQFEDLFQRVAAATTSLTLKEQIYDKADLFTATGEIDKTVLQKTLSENNFLFTNADQVNYTIDSTGIQLVSMENPSKMLKIISEGILITQDGGITWETGISANGLNANHLNAGSIDTSRVRIFSENAMTFSWDELGITAYSRKPKPTISDPNAVEMEPNKFVRLDRYGLYIVDNPTNTNFNLETNGNTWDASLTEANAIKRIKEKAKVSITKEGFTYNATKSGTSIWIGEDSEGAEYADYAIRVTNGGANKFYVKWNGDVYIDQSLQIGQWKIDNKGLYYGNDASTSTIFLRPEPLTTGAPIFQAGQNFTVSSSGHVVLKSASLSGSITWDSAASPYKVAYSTQGITPASGQYSGLPDSEVTAGDWHKIKSNSDRYQCDTGDGGTTWYGPYLIQGESALAAYLTSNRSTTFYNGNAGVDQVILSAHVLEGETDITSTIGNTGKYSNWQIQWYKDGTAISQATGTTYTVMCPNFDTVNSYYFKVEEVS